ncbi:XRE family transcriptional regulator [Streptomyces sp. BE147]|uniref:MmyB family transcriptional regulator n=1 Tax=Streptomyces sp. BE147 TaxID=3002524 RepID=UPI002E7709F1|nr:XRE family transcriptional regulator [Streptomyces sp. BE147]MEE1737048.1 XRE family transcriptional regulator [Streptomyces sp. BE147]
MATEEALAAEMRAHRLHAFLKGRRDHLALSQEAVAARLEITSRAYWNWERGRVKEWTDEKLYLLADALEMTEFQIARLFWYAVDRAPQPDLRTMFSSTGAGDPATLAFLGDYGVMMDALSLPTFVIDRRWDVKMANKAYRDLFRDVRAHPTSMPSTNFLRFGLFHPDAPTVLVDHLKWQFAMLAQLSSSLERHDDDAGLQAIRRDVYLRPPLRDAYLTDMPNWVLGSGADLVHHEGAVRELRHPDVRVGLRGCRLVEETPWSLKALGLMRLTLVLVNLDDRSMPKGALRAVSTQPDPQAPTRVA